MARDGHDHKSQDEGFDEPHPQVLHVEGLENRRPIQPARHLQLVPRHDPSAHDPDKVGDHGQHGRHHHAGEHPRHDELPYRVGPERAQRVDLVRHDHRAQLRGDARSDAPGQHQPGQHGSKLLDHRRAHQPADHGPCTELIERQATLQRQHRAREKARQQHDRQRLHANGVELLDDIVPVIGRRHDAAQRREDEADVLLHLERGFLEWDFDEGQHRTSNLRLSAPGAAGSTRGSAGA